MATRFFFGISILQQPYKSPSTVAPNARIRNSNALKAGRRGQSHLKGYGVLQEHVQAKEEEDRACATTLKMVGHEHHGNRLCRYYVRILVYHGISRIIKCRPYIYHVYIVMRICAQIAE